MNEKIGDKKRTGKKFNTITCILNSPVGGVTTVCKLTDFSAAFFLPLLSKARDEYC